MTGTAAIRPGKASAAGTNTSPAAAHLRRRSTTAAVCFVLLAVFLIAFPKGGIKISGVPLTWGYILLGLMTPLALLTLTPPPRRCLNALFMSLGFMMLILPLSGYAALSASGRGLGFIFAVMMSFGVFPIIFYIFFAPKLKRIPPHVFVTTLLWCVRFIAVYGIFLFIYKVGTGTFFEIPYLTVNSADLGKLDDKPIMRAGGFAKLISTYNNGNIYGACLPLILPVYLLFEKNPLFVGVVWASQFLTISRTAWAGGLFLIFILYFIGHKPNAKRILRGLLITFIGFILIWWLLQLLGRDMAWLFDPTMNGRVQKYDDFLSTLRIFPKGEVAAFGEIVYMGILRNHGLIGFLTFLPFFFAPWLLSRTGKMVQHPIRRAARQGLLSYYLMSCSDAAILFIPVMAFFFFTALMALEGQDLLPPNDPEARRLLK
mgnify:CR=1 FL=1